MFNGFLYRNALNFLVPHHGRDGRGGTVGMGVPRPGQAFDVADHALALFLEFLNRCSRWPFSSKSRSSIIFNRPSVPFRCSQFFLCGQVGKLQLDTVDNGIEADVYVFGNDLHFAGSLGDNLGEEGV